MDDVALSDTARTGCRPSLVNKNFLNSNATSHEWMFGAIAEILDNATDPDVLATQFWIEVETIGNQKCLILTDNGVGMDNKTLYRMLSFGFSDKEEVNGQKPIGRYGNGFKSGSMRLAKDALVFTIQNKKTMSVGMLSQTYLNKTKSETVLVPIVTWNCNGSIQYPLTTEKKSLEEITKHSIFKSEDKLLDQIYKIPPRNKQRHHGTRIVLYNLARDRAGNLEMDLDSDPFDILIPTNDEEEQRNGLKGKSKSVSKYRTSLRKYISILYLRPRMQVMLKRKKVTSICLLKCISNKKRYVYTPKKITRDPIMIDFGLNPEKDEFGIAFYHRNRLIQPFRKHNFSKKQLPENVRYQQIREIIEETIGVVELNCVIPNHIKQNFQDDTIFRNIDQNLLNRLWEYCLEILESKDARDKELDLWVQCCHPECLKWRRLPHGTRKDNIPDLWYCMMNPTPHFNYCEASEESEDEAEIQKPKRKTLTANDSFLINKNTVADDDIEEQENQIPVEMPAEMRGIVDSIMQSSQLPQGTQKARRKRLRIGHITPNKRNCSDESILESTPVSNHTLISIPVSTPSTSTESFSKTVVVKHENEIQQSEIRNLRMQLDSKQAKIVDLEQALEKVNNQLTSSQSSYCLLEEKAKKESDKKAHLEDLIAQYLSNIWPDFVPNENNVESALQQLVYQMEELQKRAKSDLQ